MTEFLPVVMITASGREQRLAALEFGGADDFVTKPFDQAELLARVASLARIKRYHDTIRRQADELTARGTPSSRPEWRTRSLSWSGQTGCATSCLRSWPIWSSARRACCRAIRREIVVVFADLRNFTPFAETSEPEEVMAVLSEYHRAIGAFGARLRRHPRAVHRRRHHGVLQRSHPMR